MDEEHENYHGQFLHLTSLTTETWVSQHGDWKLALIHAYVKLQDPPALAVSPAALQTYVDFSPLMMRLFPWVSHASAGNTIPTGTLANHSLGAARPHSLIMERKVP